MNYGSLISAIHQIDDTLVLKNLSDVINSRYKKLIQENGLKSLKEKPEYLTDLSVFIEKNFTDYQFIQAHATKWRQIIDVKLANSLVIIKIDDCLIYPSYLRCFKELENGIEWGINKNEILPELFKIAQENPHRKFLFLTSVEFLDDELKFFNDIPENFHHVCYGGDIFLNNRDYQTQPLILNKIETDKHVICFNNYPRPHRAAVVLYLILEGLDKFSKISFVSAERRMDLNFLSNGNYDTNTFLDWIYFSDDDLKSKLIQISESLNDHTSLLIEPVYSNSTAESNISNFINRLSHHYKQALVEIVTESTCFEPTLNLTEKYTNTIYGSVLPILISTQGTIKYLEDIGFDTFNDIVDHGYDSEPNPFYRMKKAIDLNRRLINDYDYAYEKWQSCITRFQTNKDFFENKFYDVIDHRRKSKLLAFKDSL